MKENRLSQALIRHVRTTGYGDIPAAALAAQKQSLADMLAVMLAATGLDAVLDGDLDEIIDALIAADQAEKLRAGAEE